MKTEELEHPMQPIGWDETGEVVRFKKNKIIRYLCDIGKININELAVMNANGMFGKGDYTQLMQLLGYSIGGFGELSSSPRDVAQEADRIASEIVSGKEPKEPQRGFIFCFYDGKDHIFKGPFASLEQTLDNIKNVVFYYTKSFIKEYIDKPDEMEEGLGIKIFKVNREPVPFNFWNLHAFWEDVVAKEENSHEEKEKALYLKLKEKYGD